MAADFLLAMSSSERVMRGMLEYAERMNDTRHSRRGACTTRRPKCVRAASAMRASRETSERMLFRGWCSPRYLESVFLFRAPSCDEYVSLRPLCARSTALSSMVPRNP